MMQIRFGAPGQVILNMDNPGQYQQLTSQFKIPDNTTINFGIGDDVDVFSGTVKSDAHWASIRFAPTSTNIYPEPIIKDRWRLGGIPLETKRHFVRRVFSAANQ